MIFFRNSHQNFVKNIRFSSKSKLPQISIKNIKHKIASQKHQRWHHCLQLNWLDLDLDYMVCTNWHYFKYLKISHDLKKYIEEYALRICNTSYLYSASTPICQSSPQRPVLQICNITSNCFAPKDFVSSPTVLRILSDIWVVVIQKTQNSF